MRLPWHLVRLLVRVLRLPGVVRTLTAGALAAVAVLHAAWARGSAFPFSTRAELAEAVVGADEVPGPAPCLAVAGALTVAAALVAGVPVGPPRLRRAGVAVVAGVLGLRGVLGLTGATASAARGAGKGERFRRLDRTYYAPVCLALAGGTASTLWRSIRRPA